MRDAGLRRWRSIAERAVRPHSVEVEPPGLNQRLDLGQTEEQLTVEQLVAKLTVEALAVTILPGTARLDIGRLRPTAANLLTENSRKHRRIEIFDPIHDHAISHAENLRIVIIVRLTVLTLAKAARLHHYPIPFSNYVVDGDSHFAIQSRGKRGEHPINHLFSAVRHQ